MAEMEALRVELPSSVRLGEIRLPFLWPFLDGNRILGQGQRVTQVTFRCSGRRHCLPLERQRRVLRIDFLGVHEVYKRILHRIEYGGMRSGPLVCLLASRSELLDGLTLAVPLGQETDIIYPAVAGHSIPADFDKTCIVGKVQDR